MKRPFTFQEKKRTIFIPCTSFLLQVVRLCRDHGLYSALVYLFNKGLDDFRTPLEELLAVLRTSKSKHASSLGYDTLVTSFYLIIILHVFIAILYSY